MLRKLPPLQLTEAEEQKVDAALDVVAQHWQRQASAFSLPGERTQEEVLDAIFAKDVREKELGRWLPTRVSTRDLEWQIAEEGWEVSSQ